MMNLAKIKKTIAILLAVAGVLSLSGCSAYRLVKDAMRSNQTEVTSAAPDTESPSGSEDLQSASTPSDDGFLLDTETLSADDLSQYVQEELACYDEGVSLAIVADQPFYDMFASFQHEAHIETGRSSQTLLISNEDNLTVKIGRPPYLSANQTYLNPIIRFEETLQKGDSVLVVTEYPEDTIAYMVTATSEDGSETVFYMAKVSEGIRLGINRGYQLWPNGLDPNEPQLEETVPNNPPSKVTETESAANVDFSALNLLFGHWFHDTTSGTEYLVVEKSGNDYYITMAYYASDVGVYGKVSAISSSDDALKVTYGEGNTCWLKLQDSGVILYSEDGSKYRGFYFVGNSAEEASYYYYSS